MNTEENIVSLLDYLNASKLMSDSCKFITVSFAYHQDLYNAYFKLEDRYNNTYVETYLPIDEAEFVLENQKVYTRRTYAVWDALTTPNAYDAAKLKDTMNGIKKYFKGVFGERLETMTESDIKSYIYELNEGDIWDKGDRGVTTEMKNIIDGLDYPERLQIVQFLLDYYIDNTKVQD